MSKITCVDVHGATREFESSELKWRPSAYGIVIKDKNVLLSKQFGDKYDLPGGGVDIEESLEDAVIREVKEETGLNVKHPKFAGFKESFFWDSHFSQNAYHSLVFYFECEFVGGELSTVGFDEAEKQYAEIAEWIPIDKLDDLGIASSIDYRPFVKQALNL
jgi:8-oxo-dGTP diphosphatase